MPHLPGLCQEPNTGCCFVLTPWVLEGKRTVKIFLCVHRKKTGTKTSNLRNITEVHGKDTKYIMQRRETFLKFFKIYLFKLLIITTFENPKLLVCFINFYSEGKRTLFIAYSCLYLNPSGQNTVFVASIQIITDHWNVILIAYRCCSHCKFCLQAPGFFSVSSWLKSAATEIILDFNLDFSFELLQTCASGFVTWNQQLFFYFED